MIINGSKEDIVNLLNKAFKHDKVSKRLSAQMTGKKIASLTYCLTASSFIPRPKTFDNWDTANSVNSFFDWYRHGCKNRQPSRTKASMGLFEKRHDEIYNYIITHPEVFKPLPDDSYDRVFHSIDKESGTIVLRKPSKPHFPSEYYDQALELMHPKLLPAYRKYLRGYYRARQYQQDKYGASGWYEWTHQNYG